MEHTKIDGPQGLTQKDVSTKRAVSGYNELPDRDKKSPLRLILGTLTEPMIFLLVLIVAVYFALGDRGESIVLSVSVIVIVIIELLQELRTEKALDALRTLASPQCIVIRDGKRQTIPSRELVPGDIIAVAEGDRLPADAKLLEATNIAADESLLTGESVPVAKALGADAATATMYSGTLVVTGHGFATVSATGAQTTLGKIGTSLKTIEPEKTRLQLEINRFVRIIAGVAIAACIVLMFAYWLMRGDILHGFLAGLTLAISALPEEFPVVLTVFMALGAWRLAKHHVLTRKNRTIETLGSATVLCTDKTGTLTENKMRIEEVCAPDGSKIEPNDSRYQAIVASGVLASQKDPFDPMEEAFIAAGKDLPGNLASVYGELNLVREYPLEPKSLSVVHVWVKTKDEHVVAAKGAPEAILALCNAKQAEMKTVDKTVQHYAQNGFRVLAVASGKARTSKLPEDRADLSYEFLGLVALADPVRKEAAPAVNLCRQAGIRVIMITGDHPETARHIASSIGLDAERVVTGDTFRAASAEEQRRIVAETCVFSRVHPEDKLTIVQHLKERGEVVAMTGDGVNDAPALKAAHIGIAMGKRGTDVAREAAAIVLLDDNFASIVQGIRIGRRIFTNLQKAIEYLLVVHIPIIMLSLLPVFLGWPLVLLPIHIVFLEFIIDPSCTLIFESEAEDSRAMQRPPRRLNQPMFGRHLIVRSLTLGLAVSAVVVATFAWLQHSGATENKARSLTFLMIVLTNLLLILSISGGRAIREAFAQKIHPLPIISVLFVALLIAVYSVPALRNLFHFASITWAEAAAVLAVAACTTVVGRGVYRLVAKEV